MQPDDHIQMKALLEENLEVAKENQKFLKKLHRASIVGIYMRVIWYALLIGLPFALYFYILEPYFEAFGSSYEVFREGIGELPGIKAVEGIFEGGKE